MSKWPTYNDKAAMEALAPGMYLGLMHGRENYDTDMNGWGFDGPCIGPLKWVHTTYVDDIKLCLVGEEDASIIFEIVNDMVLFEGNYYGDWTVFNKETCYGKGR